MNDEVLATVTASALRRWLGVGMTGFVAFVCLWACLTNPPNGVTLLVLLGIGIFAAWMGYRLWHATIHPLILTEDELRSGDGTVLVRVDDIELMDRGFFAFKPTHGFLLRTKTKEPNVWRPGMWWRMGRRIGVGGVTPGRESKFMSEVLATLIAKREMGDDWPGL